MPPKFAWATLLDGHNLGAWPAAGSLSRIPNRVLGDVAGWSLRRRGPRLVPRSKDSTAVLGEAAGWSLVVRRGPRLVPRTQNSSELSDAAGWPLIEWRVPRLVLSSVFQAQVCILS